MERLAFFLGTWNIFTVHPFSVYGTCILHVYFMYNRLTSLRVTVSHESSVVSQTWLTISLYFYTQSYLVARAHIHVLYMYNS